MKALTIAAFVFSALIISCGGDPQTPATQNAGINAPEENTTIAKSGDGVGKFKEIALGALDGALASKGEELFKSKCSACHKAEEAKLIGPGLKGVTLRRKPAWILNMMTNPMEMTQKDPTAIALLKEYNNVQMTPAGLTDEEAKTILEYLRKVDAGK